MNQVATLIKSEHDKYLLFCKQKRHISFTQYALSFYGLFSSGNRYCELCRIKYPNYFDDFCEYCGGLCIKKCCRNTNECIKYR